MKIFRTNKILKKSDEIIIKIRVKIWEKIMNNRFSLIGNNQGMGVIEVILIILVLVGLAFTFKGKVSSILNTVFSKINNKVNSF